MATTSEHRVDGYCVVGEQRYHCSQVAVNYGLNGIPTATAAVAVGKNVRTGEMSAIHQGIRHHAASGYLQPAQIYLSAENGDPVKVFEGYLTGIGYQKQRGQVHAVLSFTHWLIDVSFSSCLTLASHPFNAAQFDWTAVMVGDGSNPHNASHFLANTKFMLVLGVRYRDDLGQAVLDLFRTITESEVLIAGPGSQCFGKGDNTIARAALDRIHTSGGIGGDGGLSGAVAANLADASSDVIYDAVAEWLREQVNATYFTSSMWDKLVGIIAPSLKLSLVPLVDQALLVPFTPCLSRVGAEIDIEDVASHNLRAALQRPIRAVGVLSGIESRTGAFGPASDLAKELGVGCFARGEDDPGTVIFIDAPGWLANVPALACDAAVTTLGATGQGTKRVTPTATTPQNTAAGTGHAVAQKVLESKNVYSNLAEAFYYQELLRGRGGPVATNLRWDFSPGSTIAVNISEDEQIIGSVDRMTIWADAEVPSCGTAFQLAYLRTRQENEELGIAKHPLYQGAPFTGALLLGGQEP